MCITNQKHVGKFGALAGESSPSLPQPSRVISIPLTIQRDGPNPKTEYLKQSLGNFYEITLSLAVSYGDILAPV